MPTNDKAFKELIQSIGKGLVITNPVELISYEIDGALKSGTPEVVVLPRSVQDINHILRWANKHDMPVIAWGAGTGLAGAAVAENGGLVLSLSRMNRLLELDKYGRSVVVEPGMVNQHLADIADTNGLSYPPDPASGRSSTIGGNIAANAGGPHCFKYGVTTNYLTGVEAVLADGQILQLGGRAFDYPEYDFTGIITGSEGTIGIVTKAYLRMTRKPPGVKTLMAAFETDQRAGEAVSALIANGLVPATMEFMDQKLMRIIEEYIEAGLPVHAGAALIIEVDGYIESLSAQMNEIVTILQEHNSIDIRTAQTPDEREKIWYGRKSAAGAMARLAPAYLPLDITVPRSRLAQTIGKINLICTHYELQAAYICHAGDGNLHPLLLIEEPDNSSYMERIHNAGGEIMKISEEFNGTITGEHGVGIEKREYMHLMYNEEEIRAMLEIKGLFDPRNILNPGKVFPKIQGKGEREIGDRDQGLVSQIPDKLQPQKYPRSEEQVREIFQQAAYEKLPLGIRGGGTKSSPIPNVEHILFTNNLGGVNNIAPEDLFVNVGAGTTIDELQNELADHNMWVPIISPWKNSTIGGMVAANFNGPLRMRYGGFRDLVLAMKVILPDGRLLRAGRPVVKNVAGYDLPKLFVGSHGTLGLIHELTLKLAPLPRRRTSLIVPAESLELALKLGTQLVQVCLVASALLLCSGCENLGDAAYHLVYTAEGYPENVSAELSQVRSVLDTHGINRVEQIDSYSGSEIWCKWIRTQTSPNGVKKFHPQLVRFGIPPKSLPGFITNNAGNLTSTPFIADIVNGLVYAAQLPDAGDLPVSALESGGYAVMLFREKQPDSKLDECNYIPDSLAFMRKLKSKWDPENILNPGTFFPSSHRNQD